MSGFGGRSWWCGLVVLGLAPAGLAGAQEVFTVGQGPSCTHFSLQNALADALANGPGTDVIYVSMEMSYLNQALVVGEQSVELIGVYACDWLDPLGNRVTLSGNGSDPVIGIETTAYFRDTVVLRHLTLTGGGGFLGGGLRVEGPVRVVLDDVGVTGNTAGYGGGIFLAQRAYSGYGATVDLLPGTDVVSNVGNWGGGIYVGPTSELRIFADRVLVSQNLAYQGGGGIAVADGTVSVGTAGRMVQIDLAQGAVVASNQAGTLGGGIYIQGATSVLDAHELSLANNSAGTAGGGIAAQLGAQFSLSRDYPNIYRVQCPSSAHCSRLTGNLAPNGAAMALFQDARGFVNQTEVVGHSAGPNDAGVILVDGSRLSLESVLATGNQTQSVSNAPGGSIVKLRYLLPASPPQIAIAYSTFAGNTGLMDGQPWSASDIIVQQNGRMQLFSSAFYDSAYPATTYGPNGLNSADCVVRRPGGGFAPDVTVTRSPITANPGFVSPTDFRLIPTSPLIDYCDSTVYWASYRDLELKPRCYDRSANSNVYGPCDVGAHELAPASDLIFADGFQ